MMPHAAVVTGASSGIGKAIYEHLKGRFELVVGVSRHGPDVHADLLSPRNRGAVALYLRQRSAMVSCLINCAGLLSFGEDDYIIGRKVVELNFWAPYELIEIFEADLEETNGLVINIASISGLKAEPEEPLYGASKAALISLTKSLAVKYAPKFRVNAISPGFFDTNLVPGPTPQHLLDPIPMKYEAQPAQLLPVIDMLLECQYITGANIVVDGGLSCR